MTASHTKAKNASHNPEPPHDEVDPDAGPIDDADLAELIRNLADAVIICDPNGTITFWNAAATRVFGWTADSTIGASLDLIIPERLRDRHWQGYQRVMTTGHTNYGDRLLEVPALHRDGRRLSIAFTVSLLKHPASGVITAIAAVIRDDTERWQERQELRREVADSRRVDPAKSASSP